MSKAFAGRTAAIAAVLGAVALTHQGCDSDHRVNNVPQLGLGAPSALTGSAASSTQVDLTWVDGSLDEDGFRVERALSGGTFTLLAALSPNVTSYSDTTVTANQTYEYRVVATRGTTTAPSGIAIVITPAAAGTPAAASALASTALLSSSVSLSWTDNSNDETGFRVERANTGGSFASLGSVAANATTFSDGSVLSSTTYDYRVIAFNGNGDGPASNTLTVTTPAGQSGTGGGGGGGGATTCTPPTMARDVSNPTVTLGNGTPGSISPSAVAAAVAAGGTIVFNGGSTPYTVTLTSELVINGSVVIDGGGVLTLSGGGTTRVFRKADFFSNPTDTVVIQNLTIANAVHSAGNTGDRLRDGSGGAFFGDNSGTVEFHNVVFQGCQASPSGPDIGGGAVFCRNVNQTIVVGCSFSGNQAANGAAITTLNGDLRVYDSVFQNNAATGAGGIGPFGGSGNNGLGGLGGAISIDGTTGAGTNNTVELCGNQFLSNQANHNGGAVYLVHNQGLGGTTSISQCSFIDNLCVANEPNGNIQPMGGPGYGDTGGALYYQNGRLTLSQSMFSGNVSDWQGGGLFFAAPSSEGASTIVNCTFFNNRTTLAQFGVGGGIYVANDAPVSIQSCTLAANVAAHFAAGIFVEGTNQLNVTNTILANNTSAFMFQGQNVNLAVAGTTNIQFPGTRPDGMPEPLVSPSTMVVDPQLAATPASNGGPTTTLSIPIGSPAVNAAQASSAPAIDQRGTSRGSNPDIGAYEAP